MLTCTGSVIAVRDFDAAASFWTSVMGFEVDPDDSDEGSESSFVHPESGQRITLVEVSHPNPPMALAMKVENVDDAFEELEQGGFVEHWSDTSDDGDEFCMCRDASGVFVLLYRPGPPPG